MLVVREGADGKAVLVGMFNARANVVFPAYMPFQKRMARLVHIFKNVVVPGPNGPISDDLEDDFNIIVGYAPTNNSGSTLVDRARFARKQRYFDDVVSFFSGNWNFGTSRVIPGEHPVSHFNIVGDVVSSSANRVELSGDNYGQRTTLPANFTPRQAAGGDGYFVIDEVSAYISPNIVENQYMAYPDIKERVRANEYHWSTDSGYLRSYSVVDFDYVIYDRSSLAKYVVYRTYFTGSVWYHEIVQCYHAVLLARTAINPNWDTSRPCTSFWSSTRYIGNTGIVTETYSDGNIRYHNTAHESSFQAKALTPSSQPWGVAPSEVYSSDVIHFSAAQNVAADVYALIGLDRSTSLYLTSGGDQIFSAWNDVVTDIAPDVYPLAFFSTKEAIDKYLVGMSVNQLETISDLKSLLGLVDVLELLKNVRRLRPDKAIPLILRMLDLLTQAELVKSFSLAPTASDVQSVVSKARAFYERYASDMSRPVTIHGKNLLEVPDDLAGVFRGARIESRSKLRVRVDPDTLLLAVLSADSLGLLPTLSRVWELIPFSFVLDWFFGINKKLETVDKSAIALALSVDYSVHTHKIYYEFGAEDLFDRGISAGPGDKGGLWYQYFDRMVLPTIPLLMPSRLVTEQLSGNLPDWEVAGSLIYQLFRR